MGCLERLKEFVSDFIAKIIIFVVSGISLALSISMMGVMIYTMVGWNIMTIIDVFGSSDISGVMYALYAFLALFIIVSICGIVGVCYGSKFFTSLYAFFMMITLLGTFSVIAMYFLYGSTLVDTAQAQMLDTLQSEYDNEFAKDAISTAWNVIQMELEACGVTGPDDWINSTWYQDEPTLYGINQTFPVTCCTNLKSEVSLSKALQGKIKASDISEDFVYACYGMSSPSATTSEPIDRYSDGAKSQLISLVERSIFIVAGIGIGVILLQLLLIWAGCHLIQSKSFGKPYEKDDDEEETPEQEAKK